MQWVERSYLSTSLGENHESPGISDNSSKVLPVREGVSVYLALWDFRRVVTHITCCILDISPIASSWLLPSQSLSPAFPEPTLTPTPHLNFCLPGSLWGSELEIIVILGCFLYTWAGGTETDQPEQKGAHSVFSTHPQGSLAGPQPSKCETGSWLCKHWSYIIIKDGVKVCDQS